MNNSSELRSSLTQFYGTEQYYFNPLYRWMKYTDGVKFFAENAANGAYWLLDIIGTELKALTKKEDFLNIVFNSANNQGVITVDDGNDNILYTRNIEYTDCPEGEWKFYLTGDVLMLPTEY